MTLQRDNDGMAFPDDFFEVPVSVLEAIEGDMVASTLVLSTRNMVTCPERDDRKGWGPDSPPEPDQSTGEANQYPY